ncbi:MAG: LCP family protein [Syntrophomonadaceae bacterium]|jgi:LCP family protein required for cell wall assembly
MFKTTSFIKLMIACGLIFGLFFAVGAGITGMVQRAGNVDKQEGEKTAELECQDGERTNILLLGVDARPGEDESRSDTMLLVSIDPKINRAAVISIPRDTKVAIKGSGVDKICHANMIGGPQYAVKVTEGLLDTKIDYYVKIDFKGFEKIVDTLGGVTVDVPPGMKKLSEGINVPAGKQQRLNGHHALGFVRFRDYTMGDIERTHQQQVFMKALAAEVLKPKTITKLPKILTQVNQYVDTNMGITDMFRMASWAPGFTTDSIVAQTLPGGFYDEFDEHGNLSQSYWQVSQKQLPGLIDKMLDGEVVAVVQLNPQPYRPAIKDSVDEDEEDNDMIGHEGYVTDEGSNKTDKKSTTKTADDKKTDKKGDTTYQQDQNPGGNDHTTSEEDTTINQPKPTKPDITPITPPGNGPEGYI